MNLLWLFKQCINSKEDCLGGLVLSPFITALKLKINTDMVELMLFFPLCVVIETKPKGFLSFFFFFVFPHRDPTHLDRARMTKTPLPHGE